MAFPVIEGYTQGGIDASSIPVTLPAGIQPGDLLLVLAAIDDDDHNPSASGWTRLFYSPSDASNAITGFYRVATGSDSMTIQINDEPIHWWAFRISGVDGAPLVSSIAIGDSTSPNPPSLNAGSVDDYLWFALAGHDGDRLTAYPSGYTGDSFSGGVYAGVAWRNARVQTEDPGTFSFGSGDDWVTVTVAVRGAAEPEPEPTMNTGAFFAFF